MNNRKYFLATSIFLLLSNVTYAKDINESGFYTVVTGGQTNINSSYFNEELKSNSWSIGVGYDINKHFAAELAYQSLGNRSYKYTSSISSLTTSSSESVSAWTGSLLARYPSGNYVPYVRLGYSKVNVDMDGTSLGFASSSSVNTPLYGLGVEMKLDELASIRLEYSTTNSSASWGGTTKINMFQGGVVIRF